MFTVMKKIMTWLLTPADGGKTNWFINGVALLVLIATIIGLLTA